MSCRTSRTRSTKLPLEEPAEQTRKITDVFKVTRGRGKLHKKALVSPDHIKKEIVCTTNSTSDENNSSTNVCSSTAVESVCSPPKRAKQCAEHPKDHNVRRALFVSKVGLDVGCASLALQQEITIGQNAQSSESSADSGDLGTSAKGTTGDNKSSTHEKYSTASVDSLNPLLSRAEELTDKLNLSAVSSKARARIRSVAELQAALAEKSSVKNIHEQAQRNKSKQVVEDANAQKCSVKLVPVGPAVNKIRTTTKTHAVQRLPTPIHTVIPEFILPTHKTPQKDSVDELELDEKKHIFEYGKASRLVEKVKNNSSFPLPRNYERLHESFQSCDRVLSIYMSQGRRCVVSDVQKNVEKNTKWTFSRKQLAQIVYVYPTSYDIKVEKQWNPFGGESKSRGKFELVMTANLTDDLTGYMLPDAITEMDDRPIPKVTPVKLLSPRKKVVTALPREPVLDARPRLEGWRITCRCHIFKHKLVEIVKRFHGMFLERVGLQLNDSELARVRRFHPKFNLDEECEDIPEADLPRVPSENDEIHLEMKDYLEAVDNSAPLPKAVTTVIEELKSPYKKLLSSCSSTPLSPRKFAEQRALGGNKAMSLIERIRAKEAAKRLAESLRDPAVEKKIEVLQRIINGLLRCITTYFAFKKVRSMDVNLLAEQIMRSQSAMNRAAIMEHITALCETAPQYFAIVEIGGKKYLQMKENNYASIEKVVQDELIRLRNENSSVTVTNMSTDVNQNKSDKNHTRKSVARALF